MFKRMLLATVILSFSAASGLAQDVFVTFGNGVSSTGRAEVGDSGQAFVYVANGIPVGNFNFDYFLADSSVIEFTDASILNSPIGLDGAFGIRFDISESPKTVEPNPTSTSGRFFGTSIRGTSRGINPAFADFDAGFDADLDAFLLGTIDFDVVGNGVAEITLGPSGDFTDLGFTSTSLSLGQGTLIVGVPEPTTMGVLALGLVGYVARRRR